MDCSGNRDYCHRDWYRSYCNFAFGIRIRNRIPADIAIGINPALQPNRIRLNVPSGLRIVIPEVVVMKRRFFVVILAREAQV